MVVGEGGLFDEAAIDSFPVICHHLPAVVKYFPVPDSALFLLQVAVDLGSASLLEVGVPVDFGFLFEEEGRRGGGGAGSDVHQNLVFLPRFVHQLLGEEAVGFLLLGRAIFTSRRDRLREERWGSGWRGSSSGGGRGWGSSSLPSINLGGGATC